MSARTALLAIAIAVATVGFNPAKADTPQPTASLATTTAVTSLDTYAVNAAQEWVLRFITKHAPPGRKVWYPEAQETPEESLARYRSIAADVVKVAYHPDTKPIFVSKYHGRSMMVAVWLGIALHESGFMKHVDHNIGKYGRGDHGRSWCLMQLQIGKGRTMKWNRTKDRIPYWGDPPEEIFEGFTGAEIIKDRSLCFAEAHKIVRRSFKRCKELNLDEKLTAYAAGICDAKDESDKKLVARFTDGKKKSRLRMRSGMRYFVDTKRVRGFHDTEVIEQIAQNTRPSGPQDQKMAQR